MLRSQADPLAAPELGPGWSTAPAAYPLRYRAILTVRGTRDRTGACSWSVPIVVRDRGLAVDSRERATRLTTCDMLLEVGVPPASELEGANRRAFEEWERRAALALAAPGEPRSAPAPLDCGRSDAGRPCIEYCYIPDTPDRAPCGAHAYWDATEDAPDPGEVAPSSDTEDTRDTSSEPFVDVSADAGVEPKLGASPMNPLAATKSFSSGYQESWYEDPIGIDVTKVRNTVGWWHDGVCVRNPRTNGLADYNWYGTSGWQKVSDDLNEGSQCAYMWSSSYVKYKNPVFCRVVQGIFGGTTYNIYDRNIARGLPSGALVGEHHAKKKGGCTYFLRFQSRRQRTA